VLTKLQPFKPGAFLGHSVVH